MSNLESVFDTLRGWPDGSALENSYRPEPTVELVEGTVVETKSLQLAPADVLKMVDDSLVTAPTLVAADAGKAYVVAGTGGDWSTFDIGDVVEWSGTAWVLIVAAVEAEVAVGTRAVIVPASAAGSFSGEEEKVLEYAINSVEVTCALGNVELTNALGTIALTLAVAGYTNAVPTDIGKPVVATGSGDTGVLVSYDNGTRVWQVAPDELADVFQVADALVITAGAGIGDVDAGGVAAIANEYVNCVTGDVGKTVTGSLSSDTGVLIAYNNTTRVWKIAPTDAVADTFQDADVLSIATGTGAAIVTGGGTAAIADEYVNFVAGDVGKPVTSAGTGDSGTLVSYNNTTRVLVIDPDTPADVFAAADVLAVTAGTGAGIVTGGGVTPLGGAWSATVPVNYNRIFIDGSGSLYENKYFEYIGTHATGAWVNAFVGSMPHVSKLSSGVVASVVRDEAWLVIQGNDQFDAQFVDKVTCLKLMTGLTFKVATTIANTLAPGDLVSANAGVLEKTVAGGGMKHNVGMITESNGVTGAGGIITVSS